MRTTDKSSKYSRKLNIQLLEILAISILMTAIMSGGVLCFKHGTGKGFFKLWLNDFLLSCCIAIPAGYLIVPLVALCTKRFKK
ncbi:DUF2798 domain-containing protein [Pedobacter sp. L105]|uniref:DUF2798 domain-containing protein n=1 Tax=Pedobacter sp. L105 TaxID=1641871 RepID=UPI00131DCB0A|nr:DUF2798 domain-containing protein [Pedobacter sp. L105]